jgi:hypothetical protein
LGAQGTAAAQQTDRQTLDLLQPLPSCPGPDNLDQSEQVLSDGTDADKGKDVAFRALQTVRAEVPAIDKRRHSHRDDDARALAL